MKDVRGVSVCLACGGAFLAGDAVDTVRRAFDEHAQSMASLAAQQGSRRMDGVRAVACPTCRQQMARFQVGPVEVDTCFAHGSWYDRGELVAVKDALAAGLPTAAIEQSLDIAPKPARVIEPVLDPRPPAPAPPGGGGFRIDAGAAKAIGKLRKSERTAEKRERKSHRRRHGHDHSGLEIVTDILDILT